MLGTATKLETARKIEISGAVNGNANFDGSGNIKIPVTAPVSKVTKTLTDSGITINVVLKKQFNIVYANFNIIIPKNTTTTIGLNSVLPTGYIPTEILENTISEKSTNTQYLKLYLKDTGGVTGLVINESTTDSVAVTTQFTYIVD